MVDVWALDVSLVTSLGSLAISSSCVELEEDPDSALCREMPASGLPVLGRKDRGETTQTTLKTDISVVDVHKN